MAVTAHNEDAARKGDWVQIHRIVLEAGARAPQVPEDTQKVPLEARIKGFLANETAQIGEEVAIRTLAGRQVEGRLVAINPVYGHDFGEPIPELLAIGPELRRMLEERKDREG